MIRALAFSALVLVAACSKAPAPAAPEPLNSGAWSVVADESRLSFVSVKSNAIAEAHHFTKLSGGVSPEGVAQIDIDLASLETLLEQRNERMREFLFDVQNFPAATVSATLDPNTFATMDVGARTVIPLDLTVDLHGMSAPAMGNAYVTRVGANRVAVESVDPIVVYAATHDLTDGIEELRGLAELDSIAPVAPVTFSLVLERS
ncbi:MAG: YceI family protein [Pseudomonadota bacterium]